MEEQENSVQKTDDLEGRLLTFYIEDTVYSIELMQVLEIINMQNIQGISRVPDVPGYIRGIINLRGKVVPVIDVRRKLNKPLHEDDDKTCVIVVVTGEMQVGLIVDQVSEVITITSDCVASLPEIGSRNADRYLKSVVETENKIILNIDCQKFFQSDLI